MKTKVQRWGNGLAIRIPKAFAAGLRELLARVTPENLHAEIDLGPAVGREAW